MKKPLLKKRISFDEVVRSFEDIHFILTSLKPRNIKVFYWKYMGKDFEWIAKNKFNDEIGWGRCKNLYWEIRKKLGKYKNNGIFAFFVINVMIDKDPEKIDDWPIFKKIDWEDFVRNGLGVDEELGMLIADGDTIVDYVGLTDEEKLKFLGLDEKS
jgi:hypothetical protein